MVAGKLDPKVQIAPAYAAQRRRARRPQHNFQLETLPYQLQPFCIAPVIPGETLTDNMLMSQCWSDPLVAGMKNIGWWQEYFLFYVRHRDFVESVRPTVTGMMLDPQQDMSAITASSNAPKFYRRTGDIDWLGGCYQPIVANYFRDENETTWDQSIGAVAQAKIYGRGRDDMAERLTMASEYEDRRTEVEQGTGGEIYVNEIQKAQQAWAAMSDMGLVDMDYEDFIRTYGVQVREDENSINLHMPELVWHNREWTYPTNTVEPTTGVPAVAVGWRTQKSFKKRVFFDEPGFLVGITVVRPKVYLGNQLSSRVCSLTDVRAWLPAVLAGEQDHTHQYFGYDEGPFSNLFGDGEEGEEGYWLDIRDLLINGDQFLNMAPGTPVNSLSLPEASGERRYAALAEVQAMFAAGENGYFRQDGVLHFSILGRQSQPNRSTLLGMR